ncbi:hypothetical protein [Paenibacillus sp. UNC217MF]|uniref:hypothetical protein n=1 Tax=Paenibacillus sp. UNC217MF TaxID=1449062 RepID=UPI00048EBCD3|nr:hypothetical protein [Paenibacillus sp. UNC217MF]
MNDFFTQMACKTLLVSSSESSSAFALPDLKEGALASLAFQPQIAAPLLTPEPAMLGESRVELLERNVSGEEEVEPSSLVKRSRPLVRREKANSESDREDEEFSALRSESPRHHERITTASRQSADQKERLQFSERLPIVPQPANVFSPNTDVQKSNGVPYEQDQTEQPQQLIRPVGMIRFESVFSPTLQVQQNQGVQPGEQPRQPAMREAESTASTAVPHVIKVSIGRVDVRALVTSTPPRQMSQITAQRSALQEYLEARNQGKL